MGDTRFLQHYERIKRSDQPAAEIRNLSDPQVVEALAAASTEHDPYLANVLATEALNRLAERDRLEEDLERTEARFRRVAMATNDAVWDWDLETDALWWSDGFYALFGYDPREVAPTIESWYTRLHPDDRDRVVSDVHAAIDAGEEAWEDEYRFRRDDGTYARIHDRGYTIRDADGRAVRMVGAMLDVTKRQRAEAALRESEARYAALFHSIRDAIIVSDTERGILSCNPAFTELTGYTLEELRGHTAARLYANPEEFEAMGRAVRDNYGGAAFARTMRFRRKGGEEFTAEVRVSYLHGAGGDVEGFIGTVRDVTAREEAREAQRAAHARVKGILESVTDAFFALDRQWRFTYVNAQGERLVRRSRSELLGRSVWEMFPEAVGTRFEREYRRAAETGEARHFEAYYPPLETWFEVHAYPGGEGLSVFFRDVSERVRREEELRAYRERLEEMVAERTDRLRAANRELEAFAYRVAHDLKAHLRAIGFFGEVLEEDYGGALDARGADYIRRMRGESGRLQRLVGDLLAFSHSGERDVDRRRVDVSAVARDVAEGLRERAPGHAVDVTIEPGLEAHADPQLVRVVLDNLLGNAWKYTANEATARIELAAREAEGGAEAGRVFFVRDNGAGFPPERTGELFQPFHRLHGPEEFEGTGVGLATVKRAVEAHGGRVWAESGGRGEGATFYFTLEEDGESRGAGEEA